MLVYIVLCIIGAMVAYVAVTGDEDILYFLGTICAWMIGVYVLSIIHYTIGA